MKWICLFLYLAGYRSALLNFETIAGGNSLKDYLNAIYWPVAMAIVLIIDIVEKIKNRRIC